jgi:hypothetical protein
MKGAQAMTRIFCMIAALLMLALPATVAAQDQPAADVPATEAAAPAQPETPALDAPASEPEPEPQAVVPEPVDAAAPESAGEEAQLVVESREPSPGNLAFGMPAAHGLKWLRFNATLQTVFVYQNDSDFDGTPPYYDANGQSVGLMGTFFKPRLELIPIEEISIVWEMELGLNLWSRHNPDQYNSGQFDTFRLAQRELYVKGEFMDGLLGFKVGYQFLQDPTRLFLGHWAGAASFISKRDWAEFSFTLAQLPDQTFEGVTLSSNNFNHDTFVYGLQVGVPFSEWDLDVGLWGLHDSQVIGQTLNLFAPTVHVEADYDFVVFGLDAALQVGTNQNGASQGDEKNLAWALQAYANFDVDNFGIDLNQLILSGDDAHNRNTTNGAFYYSGKSRSRTLLLTENEIRDVGGNLDERLSETRGKFYIVRPGMSVTDLALSYNVEGFFIPAVIVGAGFVLEPDNALGGKMVGVETDLDLEFVYRELLSFHLTAGLLIPGGAGAALTNSYDRTATRTQYMLESSLSVSF